MSVLTWNLVKALAGLVVGVPVLAATALLTYWAQSLVLTLFFTVFYTALDKSRDWLDRLKTAAWVTIVHLGIGGCRR